MFVQEADVCLVAAARVEANSQSLTCCGVVVVTGLRAGDDASLPLGVVIASAHRPLGATLGRPLLAKRPQWAREPLGMTSSCLTRCSF